MNRTDTSARIAIPVLVCLLLSACASVQDEQLFVDDVITTIKRAEELTSKGDQLLFLPNNRFGDPDAARDMYIRSNKLLDDFMVRWIDNLRETRLDLVDLKYIENARGLAYVAFLKKDWDKAAQYRHKTIDLALNTLSSITRNPIQGAVDGQFPSFKHRLWSRIAEAHFYLSIQYFADRSKARDHLKLARKYADLAENWELKASIDQLLKTLK